MTIPPDLWLFVFSTLILLCLTAYAWRLRAQRLGRAFLLQSAMALLWTAAFTLESASPTLEGKLLFARIGFVGIAFLPLSWLYLALTFVEQERPRRCWLVLASFPLSTLALVWLVPPPNLFWGPLRLDTSGPFPVLDAHYNIWFYAIHAASSYILLLVTIYVLLRRYPGTQRIYRMQKYLLLLAVILPAVTDLLYVLGFSPIPHYNFTTAVFSISGVLCFWALFRYHLFDMVPMARDAIIEAMQDAVVVLDTRNRLVDLNSAAKQLEQRSAEALGKPVSEIWTNFLALAGPGSDGATQQTEVTLSAAIPLHFDMLISPIRSRDGRLLGRIITFRDVTERVKLFQQVQELAIHDSLTQAFTRRYFLEAGQNEIDRSYRYPSPGPVLILIDVDYLKQINDTYGHAAGDTAMQTLARICQTRMRTQDVFGRIGGDEFAILLPETSKEGALVAAERILSQVRQSVLMVNGQQLSMTASLGIATLPEFGRYREGAVRWNIDMLMACADRALYQAKTAGRNRAVLYQAAEA